ncbi:MAG: 2-C-methyl-D-erythritol 4-phosphate cytidylyltransferase [Fibrobacteria bacterium]|nr:2-C-methyl-D-erythritol 4-phosphate cytidylyltransferase [Fibrobacteria bacterium]
MNNNMNVKTGVVLPAGGKGVRFGGEMPKQFYSVGSQPLFMHSLDIFSAVPEIDEIVLVLPKPYIAKYASLQSRYEKLLITEGGAKRWNSVQNGFYALSEDIECILVHDVARPFLPVSVIRRCLEKLRTHGNNVAALPVVDTTKYIENDLVTRTIDRKQLISVQTPQSFTREALLKVYTELDPASGILQTDEACFVEAAGMDVYWVEGSPLLHKVTNQEDLAWAGWIENRIQSGEINLYD